MSDSQEGISSPMSPSVHIINDGGGKPSGSDLDISVERRIRDMISILSQCVGDIAKEKQVRFLLASEWDTWIQWVNVSAFD